MIVNPKKYQKANARIPEGLRSATKEASNGKHVHLDNSYICGMRVPVCGSSTVRVPLVVNVPHDPHHQRLIHGSSPCPHIITQEIQMTTPKQAIAKFTQHADAVIDALAENVTNAMVDAMYNFKDFDTTVSDRENVRRALSQAIRAAKHG